MMFGPIRLLLVLLALALVVDTSALAAMHVSADSSVAQNATLPCEHSDQDTPDEGHPAKTMHCAIGCIARIDRALPVTETLRPPAMVRHFLPAVDMQSEAMPPDPPPPRLPCALTSSSPIFES